MECYTEWVRKAWKVSKDWKLESGAHEPRNGVNKMQEEGVSLTEIARRLDAAECVRGLGA